MRPKPQNEWRKEVRSLIQPTMYERVNSSDSNFFKAGFKTGYRLALQHIGNYKAMDFSRRRNVKITKVSPIIDAILYRSANHFGVDINLMLSDKRDRHLVIARSVAINLLKELTPYSLHNIGEILAGKDHTTIIHHISCKAQKNGLWFPYFEIWNSFSKLKLELEADFKVQK
jgi:hypothetical protein